LKTKSDTDIPITAGWARDAAEGNAKRVNHCMILIGKISKKELIKIDTDLPLQDELAWE